MRQHVAHRQEVGQLPAVAIVLMSHFGGRKVF
jgi:hypothetical protein